MTELTARTPCAGLLPVEIGALRLTEVAPGAMTALAPFRGRDAALCAALEAAHGLAVPGPGQSTQAPGTQAPGARALWFGQRMILLMGPAPAPELARHAALTDQSDAWAVLRLDGADARAVLARLTPLDLRAAHFPRGATARSELRHMMAAITRVEAAAWQLMVFRGFAGTLVHDLRIAMESVAARAGP